MQSALGQPGSDLPGSPRVASPPLHAGVPARRSHRAVLTWMAFTRAIQIDRDLAAGASSRPQEVLALRAKWITGRRCRLRLADGLVRVLSGGTEAGAALTAAVQPDRRAVLSSRVVLADLERRLRTPEPVGARGMAMLRLLLTEPDSPLYRAGDAGVLDGRLRDAAAALEQREALA
jgi:hypothetical protein